MKFISQLLGLGKGFRLGFRVCLRFLISSYIMSQLFELGSCCTCQKNCLSQSVLCWPFYTESFFFSICYIFLIKVYIKLYFGSYSFLLVYLCLIYLFSCCFLILYLYLFLRLVNYWEYLPNLSRNQELVHAVCQAK